MESNAINNSSSTNDILDIAIIGGGPASYMAAIYAHTANTKLIFIKTESSDTYNFSGYDKVIGITDVSTPEQLLNKIHLQCLNFKINLLELKIFEIELRNKIWFISTENSEGNFAIIRSKCLIVDDLIIFDKFFSRGKVEELREEGLVVCGKLDSVNEEAVVLFGSGCMSVFHAKEYLGI